MAFKVVGAGLGRTGTHSLKLALEQLTGEPCYHMVEVFKNMHHCPVRTAAAKGECPDWGEFLSGYGSAVDWPSAVFYKEMADAFPDALVVLSVRDSQEWWASASPTIFSGMAKMPDPSWQEMIQTLLATRSNMNPKDEQACIAAFESHNEEVKRKIPAERLLVWNVTDGWAPLCAALNLPVPDGPFPKSNDRESFIKHIQDRESGGGQ